MKKYICIFSLLFLCGCTFSKLPIIKPNYNDTHNNTISAMKYIDESKELVEDITKKTDEIIILSQDKPKVIESAQVIKEDVIKLDNLLSDANKNLALIFVDTKKIKETTETIIKENKELTKENTELKTESKQRLNRGLTYLILFGVVVLTLSIIGLYSGNIKSISGIIGSLLLIVISVALSYFSYLIAIIGVVAILIIGMLIFLDIRKHKKAVS